MLTCAETPVQVRGAAAMLAHETGMLVAPPGVGKTVLGAYLIAKRKVSTLVLVHRKPLLDQWVEQLSAFLGIPKKAIGALGGGRRRSTGQIDVAMLQSLVRKGQVADLVAGYGHVVDDECITCRRSSSSPEVSRVTNWWCRSGTSRWRTDARTCDLG